MDGFIGRKIGMTSIFDQGKLVPCTVIDAGENVVTQVKSEEMEGYNAVQLSYGKKKKKSFSKALIGHFQKAGVDPLKKSVEFKNTSLSTVVGTKIKASDVFEEGDVVNIVGVSKGKGFQGVVKRHKFKGVGDMTHGQHNRQRAPGAIGACATPSKVIKGMKMAGQMGNKRVMTKNLRILKILEDKNLLLVKGCVPGHRGSYVIIQK